MKLGSWRSKTEWRSHCGDRHCSPGWHVHSNAIGGILSRNVENMAISKVRVSQAQTILWDVILFIKQIYERL